MRPSTSIYITVCFLLLAAMLVGGCAIDKLRLSMDGIRVKPGASESLTPVGQ